MSLSNIIIGYILVIVLESLILPTEQWLHDNLKNKEIARKWGHVLHSTILWTVCYYFLKGTVHSIIITILYSVSAIICNNLGLIADKRENCESNNDKSNVIQGIGYTFLTTMAYFNPVWWLYYGLGIFSLAFGDAAAALIGIKYGKYSIRFSNNKSLIGSIAYIIAATLGMLIPCIIMEVSIVTILPKLLLLSIIGSIVEAISGDWDNFFIQISVAFISSIIL